MLVHGGALIDVEIEGSKAVPVVIKEQQRHPVRGHLIHLDLQEVNLLEEIQADVTIELIGSEDSPGVKEGGVLEHVTHEITITALPTAIPESIPADVSGMEIGDTLQLSALIAPEGVEFFLGEDQDADEITIATLSPPRVEEEPEPEHRGGGRAGRRGRRADRASRGRGGRGGRGRRRARRVRRLRRLRRGVALRLFGRRPEEQGDRFLIVGLGNPGDRYARTRHNIGFRVAAELAGRWDMAAAKEKYRGRIAEGRMRPGGPRVAILTPQTFMNESGDSAGPARGQLRVPLDRVIAVHDEIDLPFGEIRAKLGGGVAGHNGLKSLKRGLGIARLLARAGRRRPARLDRPGGRRRPTCSARFSEPDDEVAGLISAAADETERLVDSLASEANENE